MFFFLVEEGEEGEEDLLLSYDKFIMLGIKFKIFFCYILLVLNIEVWSRNCFVCVFKFWILEWYRIWMNCEVNLLWKRCYCWNLRDVVLLKIGVVEVGFCKLVLFVCN